MQVLKRGGTMRSVFELPIREEISRMRYTEENDLAKLDELETRKNRNSANCLQWEVSTMRLPEEYKTISNLSGPLMMVNKVSDVSYDELAEITLANGEHRRGRVLEISGDRALVQVYEGSSGIDVNTTQVRFLGDVLKLPVSRDMLGRIFNGRGDPIDGGPAIIPETTLDVNGTR